MASVGVRELRQRASELLRRVEAGETIEITDRGRPVLSTYGRGCHSVRDERLRYTRYRDGTEELYDTRNDPNEWNNLAGKPEHAGVIAEHKRWLPKIDLPPAPNSANRVLTYDRRTDEAIWEGKTVRRNDPIPE